MTVGNWPEIPVIGSELSLLGINPSRSVDSPQSAVVSLQASADCRPVTADGDW